MIFNRKNGFALVTATICLASISLHSFALPNISTNGSGHRGLLRTAAACQPATAAIDLDINNVRARIMTGGDMWWNIGTSKAAYEVPKGGGASSLFAGSCWIGGYDKQGNLKVAAQTYRQDGNDYWPGALESKTAPTITKDECSAWDKFWKINKSDILAFISLSKTGQSTSASTYDVIRQWPARGNSNVTDANGSQLVLPAGRDYAPFVDVDNDGLYDPSKGDYPDIDGDQYIWWVFNDVGNVKQQTQTASIGLEVQASAFAYSTNDNLNNATFYNYHVINRGALTLDSTYIATWSDADLGWAYDDYIGCDTTRGLGVIYNGNAKDGTGDAGTYGDHPPMCGVDFFKGPKRQVPDPLHPGKTKDSILTMTVFDYYNNDFTDIGNPSNGLEIYNYMTGSLRKGERFSDDWNGVPGTKSRGYGKGPISKFVFTGDPEPTSGTWSECVCGNLPWDRRFIHSSGPFTLTAGDFEDITIGAVWVPNTGGCPNASFKAIRAADDEAQALFDNNFKTLEGPEAPRLVVRELDRRLVFYLENDPSSNNYREQYGYQKDSSKYRSASSKAKNIHSPDSLYKFEGYRVFQLIDGSKTPAQIFDASTGEVDPTIAKEVFQCDIKNGVTQIVNYVKNTSVSDTTFVPQIKVVGKDSGIVHSFTINQDQFSTTNDKTIVNYRTYYYVAIAYAYNNFAKFNPRSPDSSQDVAYLGSGHGAGSTPIVVVAAMPNPSNGNMGNTLNSDYGTGVSIKRIYGTGNGGNDIELTQNSENLALLPDSGYIARQAEYRQGNAPVNVKVVDPVAVLPADWQLFLTTTMSNNNGILDPTPGLLGGPQYDKGINPADGTWMLVANVDGHIPDTIYSERNISLLNEQILEKYGISVSIQQTVRPGDDQVNGNGYITSSISFADTSLPWLAGVQDQSGVNIFNWLRSGLGSAADTSNYCDFFPIQKYDTTQFYDNMLSNNSATVASWGPYSMGATSPGNFHGGASNSSPCGFTVSKQNTISSGLGKLFSVDVVLTSDKAKWTKCLVLEEQEDPALAQGGGYKFGIRRHEGWTGNLDAQGNPIYSTDTNDIGFSWFPGYAINQETGERVNIVFGEDSWLKGENGADMIWNPTKDVLNPYTGDVIFGGKHYIYVANTRYDGGVSMKANLKSTSQIVQNNQYASFQWVGVPVLAQSGKLLSLKDGLIPTETRIRIRVTRPYAVYDFAAVGTTTPTNAPVAHLDSISSHINPAIGTANFGLPYYTFTTKGLDPTPVSDTTNRSRLLSRINVVPNPYYGYSGYENNRLDTRVRIINLPAKASINIYSLDGTLIRSLTKVDPTVSYVDWDIRNAVGLTVSSGMYLIDVKADGIGETVLRWFGSLRPIDITQF
jgi:hypothetical protein